MKISRGILRNLALACCLLAVGLDPAESGPIGSRTWKKPTRSLALTAAAFRHVHRHCPK